jgi:hypothetical protein
MIAANPCASPRFRALVPGMERIFRGGWKCPLNNRGPRHARASADGARRIRTADLLGAMHEGRLMRCREKGLIRSAFVTID